MFDDFFIRALIAGVGIALVTAFILWKWMIPSQLSSLQVGFEIDDGLYEVHRLTKGSRAASKLLSLPNVGFGVALYMMSMTGVLLLIAELIFNPEVYYLPNIILMGFMAIIPILISPWESLNGQLVGSKSSSARPKRVRILLRRFGTLAVLISASAASYILLMPRIDELYEGGENLTNIDKSLDLQKYEKKPLTANAYLGAWGIKEALDNGADVVICPRVTDAAVVIGPAAWKYNWSRDQYDELAGALAAGHIIECGAQATGGNYSFFQEVPTFDNIGYPIAEIYEDGSFVITKHENTGGLVSVGTVTAQLLYEIGSPAYLNPDVISHFDTLEITQESKDRVLVTNNRGSSPTKTHKVCINLVGGFRNGVELLLTGLDIDEKSKLIVDQIFKSVSYTHLTLPTKA